MKYGILGGGAVLLTLALGAWFFLWPSSVPVAEGPVAQERTPPVGSLEYMNVRYGFSLFYPNYMKIAEFDEGGGASTITFQHTANTDAPVGFQIFVLPYDLPQVSEERFRQDLPSGVRESLENVTIDGATGAAFYSSDASLGETREVWFIRSGYLYEVTTLKTLEADLLEVLKTWKFF